MVSSEILIRRFMSVYFVAAEGFRRHFLELRVYRFVALNAPTFLQYFSESRVSQIVALVSWRVSLRGPLRAEFRTAVWGTCVEAKSC